jgi:hypothetical protein
VAACTAPGGRVRDHLAGPDGELVAVAFPGGQLEGVREEDGPLHDGRRPADDPAGEGIRDERDEPRQFLAAGRDAMSRRTVRTRPAHRATGVLLGLRWTDLDLNSGTAFIGRTL